jgi:hypothetical protein
MVAMLFASIDILLSIDDKLLVLCEIQGLFSDISLSLWGTWCLQILGH